MKFRVLILLTLCSCERLSDVPDYSGTYTGRITYDLPALQSFQSVTKTISNNLVTWNYASVWKDVTYKTTFSIQPDAFCYTLQDIVLYDTTSCGCDLVTLELSFSGAGYLKGDTLYENGIVTEKLYKSGKLLIDDMGFWNATLIKTH